MFIRYVWSFIFPVFGRTCMSVFEHNEGARHLQKQCAPRLNYSYEVSSCYVVPCHARSRGDIGVVLLNKKGGCLLCSVNSTDTTHCSVGSYTFVRRNFCEGILLPAVTLTDELDWIIIPLHVRSVTLGK